MTFFFGGPSSEGTTDHFTSQIDVCVLVVLSRPSTERHRLTELGELGSEMTTLLLEKTPSTRRRGFSDEDGADSQDGFHTPNERTPSARRQSACWLRRWHPAAGL